MTIELYQLTPRYKRYSATNLAVMLGSVAGSLGEGPLPIEISTADELQRMICPERVAVDDATDFEQVLDALSERGCWLAPDHSIFVLDRSFKGPPDDGEPAANAA